MSCYIYLNTQNLKTLNGIKELWNSIEIGNYLPFLKLQVSKKEHTFFVVFFEFQMCPFVCLCVCVFRIFLRNVPNFFDCNDCIFCVFFCVSCLYQTEEDSEVTAGMQTVQVNTIIRFLPWILIMNGTVWLYYGSSIVHLDDVWLPHIVSCVVGAIYILFSFCMNDELQSNTHNMKKSLNIRSTKQSIGKHKNTNKKSNLKIHDGYNLLGN